MHTPSLLRRLASLLYEALVVIALLLLAAAMVTMVSGEISGGTPRLALQGLATAMVSAYFVWCWMRGGQTLAMKAWHIRVVEPGRAQLRLATAIKRFVLAAAGLALAGIGWWWALLDRDRQFLHDRLAGTRLVMHDARARD